MQYFAVGLHGRKGSGKSTVVAPALKAAWMTSAEREFHRISFGDPLKQVCHIMYGGTMERWWGTQDQKEAPFPYWGEKLGENYSSARKILQTMGSEIARKYIKQDIWVMIAARRTAELLTNCERHGTKHVMIVFDDVRYAEEATWLRSIGSPILRIEYANNPEAQDAHSSEKELPSELIDDRFTFNNKEEVSKFAKLVVTNLEMAINAQERPSHTP